MVLVVVVEADGEREGRAAAACAPAPLLKVCCGSQIVSSKSRKTAFLLLSYFVPTSLSDREVRTCGEREHAASEDMRRTRACGERVMIDCRTFPIVCPSPTHYPSHRDHQLPYTSHHSLAHPLAALALAQGKLSPRRSLFNQLHQIQWSANWD